MNTVEKEILNSRLGTELSDDEAAKLAEIMHVKELHG